MTYSTLSHIHFLTRLPCATLLGVVEYNMVKLHHREKGIAAARRFMAGRSRRIVITFRIHGGMRRRWLRMLMASSLALQGCSTLKQMAPNQWNVTVPTGTVGKPYVQGVWFGVGGALPWGKQ